MLPPNVTFVNRKNARFFISSVMHKVALFFRLFSVKTRIFRKNKRLHIGRKGV